MSCVICQDVGSESLQDNTACACKYKRHITCWIDYVHSNKELYCPLCRKDISTKSKKIFIPQVRPVRLMPYIPSLDSISEERSRQTSYEELNDSNNNISQSYQNSTHISLDVYNNNQSSGLPNQTQSNNRNSTTKNIWKAILCLAIVGTIIVLAIMIL